MNDQAKKILIDLLQKASDGINSAVSFSKAQIPDVVHQLLVWNFVESMIYFLSSGLTSLWLILFAVKALRKRADPSNEGRYIPTIAWDEYGQGNFDDGQALIVALFYLMLLGFFIATCVTSLDWLQIWLAPKLYIIQYAAQLIK